MEFTEHGLELTRQEARDVAEVFSITASLNNWGPLSGVVHEPTTEERTEARGLVWQAAPTLGPDFANPNMLEEDRFILGAEHFPTVKRIAELALDNSQKIISGLCTPNVCDGYRSEWRPAAYHILAMTAEISEKIQILEQNPSISPESLNAKKVPSYPPEVEHEKTIEERTIEVGQALRERRQALGYNQAEIARMAGMTRTYLNMIENAERPKVSDKNKYKLWPSRKMLTGLSVALDLDTDMLLTLAGYDVDA